jgi:succinate dehydrogenase / fumarate reductase membrane anchor subunit
MRFLTPHKRAYGLGAAHRGTEHHWRTYVSSVALLILVPLFVFTFGSILGRPYEEAVAALSRPFPAIVIGLSLAVGLVHFRQGQQVMWEDYSGGLTRKLLIIGTVLVSYVLLAVGLFAVARLAL